MHPIEHLRYLARAGTGADAEMLVSEAAHSLAACASDPAALLTSARTLLKHQPDVGALWWLCARLLTAIDVRAAAWECLDELRSPDTGRTVAGEIPDGARVCYVGAPTHATSGFKRRGDVHLLVVEVDGSSYHLERELSEADVECETVEAHQLGAVIEFCDLVIVEPSALGESAALAPPGVVPTVATARLTHTPVWMVCGPGQRLPEPFCQAIIERVVAPAAVPWLTPLESLGLASIDRILTASGAIDGCTPPDPTCTFTPELL